MRLNLGCGVNLLEDWVNVDIDDVEGESHSFALEVIR